MKVSVCMATYNAGKYLKAQVESILGQQFVNNPEVELELIVSDDLSSDGTYEALLQYQAADSRVKVYRHTQRCKTRYYQALFAVTRNFEHALTYATGDYIFFSDQDDVWYPQKLDVSIDALKTHKMVACSFDWIDQDDQHLSQKIYTECSFLKMWKRFPYYGFSIGFHKDYLSLCKPFPAVPQHDIYLGLVARLRGDLSIIAQPLCAHRKYLKGKSNVSDSGFGVPTLVKLYYRMKMLACVLLSYFR